METDLQGFHNKPFLYECICNAISDIQNKGQLKGVFIQPHQGLENIPGTPEVAQQMYEQVDKYELFIGDVTTVQRLDSAYENNRNKNGIFFRYSPNCNVYGEYNRALGKFHDSWQQVILLSNTANKSPEEDATVIPFDTRGRRWAINFLLSDDSEESKANARKQLMGTLKTALIECSIAAVRNIRKRYEPFENWYKTRNNGLFKKIKNNQDLVKKYKNLIFNGDRITCISGKIGSEKAVLVLQIFEEFEFANNCLYIDNNRDEFPSYKSVLRQIFRDKAHNQDIIIIIDNCSTSDLESIITERKAEQAGNRVIAIMNKEDAGKKICFKKVTYIDVTQDFADEMDAFLMEAGVNKLYVSEIKAFCEDKTDLVKIIASEDGGIRDCETTPEILTSKLLGNKQYPHEREIMRALSLFDCVGWKDDKSSELDFIITNNNILPLGFDKDSLISEARAIISKNIKRGLIVEHGRTITVSAKHMAYQLLTEWLNEVDEIRFCNLLNDLTGSEYKNRLSRELHDRFRNLKTIEDDGSIIKQLFKPGGMFDNVRILNTEVGAMLFAGFAEVYPKEACDLLVRVLNAQSIDELRQIDSGRRHLVWLIEKLAFRTDYFEDAAELLLRLGIAENETYGNNASAEFIRLFPFVLPATTASLDTRLSFLQKYIAYDEYRPLIMRALKSALVTRDNVLMGGAETLNGVKLTPYYPNSNEEGERYISGVLKLLEDVIVANGDDRLLALEALQANVTTLCINGWAYLVLNTIKKVAGFLNGNWEKMQETLSFFRKRICNVLDAPNKIIYEEILEMLTKNDFISRFKRVEKESHICGHYDFDKIQQERKQKFIQIANEIYGQKALNKELLKELIEVDCLSSNPFGETLANKMDNDEQLKFVEDYVQIINQFNIERIDILCNFIQPINDETFLKMIPILQKCAVSYTLFACFGLKSIKPSDELFALLCQRIEKGRSSNYDFIQYWTRIRINLFEEKDYVDLFNVIISNSDSFPVIVKMSSFLLREDNNDGMIEVSHIISDSFINYGDNPTDILCVDNALYIAGILLQKFDNRPLASKINHAIISYAKQQQTYFSPTFEIVSVYQLLMDKYFYTIWSELSESLLSDGEEFMTYYNLKNLLGVNMVNENEPIILKGGHFQEMMQWCEQNPDIAPARLAGLIQVAKDGKFTNEAIELINRYANKEYVLNELECSLNSFSFVGSAVPEYEYRKDVFSTMLDHINPTVRLWAQKQVNSCTHMIEYESIRDAEKW